MIMKNKYIFLLFLSVFGVFVFSPLEAVAKKKKKGKIEQVKPKSAYEKLLKDKPNSVETKGLMNLYWVDDKVYMEIPRDVLGKRLPVTIYVFKSGEFFSDSLPERSQVFDC